MTYLPYIIMLILPIFLYILDNKKYLSIDHKFIFVIYFLFSSLRGNGNGDYFSYINAVKYIKTFDNVLKPVNYPFEIGLRLINYVNNLLNLNPQFTIAAMSLISLSTMYYIISKYSDNKYLSWFFYFSFLLYFDMHHSRTGIAVNFMFLSYLMLTVEKRWPLFLIFSTAALMFHNSALFAIFIILIIHLISKKINIYDIIEKYFIIIIVISLIIINLISVDNVVLVLSKIFKNSLLIIKLQSYLSNDLWSYKFNLYDPRLIVIIAVLYFAINYIKPKNSLVTKGIVYLFISILTAIYFSNSTVLVLRLYNYFQITIVLLLPLLIMTLNTSNKLCSYSFIGIYMLYFTLLIAKEVPYIFYFLR